MFLRSFAGSIYARAKKIPDRCTDPGRPCLSQDAQQNFPDPRGNLLSFQAGLLTFPIIQQPSRHFVIGSGIVTDDLFLFHSKKRDYSGGPVPDSHGIPFFSPCGGPVRLLLVHRSFPPDSQVEKRPEAHYDVQYANMTHHIVCLGRTCLKDKISRLDIELCRMKTFFDRPIE